MRNVLLKQRNNLRIFYNGENYFIKSPCGVILEEFKNYSDSLKFCNNTKDFINYKI